ncbi:uncharacterized protein EV420DRAFT_1592664 [Desarmillaria tabescens]|uniref:HMG box domain-containing protein n=1 Tax=Armillaria tabescens TaxID=1929756 RepID=A0AA39J4W7_ARMTA|nr:uncharacterized protein EV420DRAFT_1592664 [Desarmillaria tabescens]KAK0435689.1 hypothetical protein EV420DRAFT_1592664 [Desarmillaria tabescens]
MAHAHPGALHYDSFPNNLLLAHNGTLALAPPASRTAAPVPSFAATQPYQIRGRRPRNPSTIFRDIFFATYKVLLPSNEAEVSRLASDAWHELSEEERLFYKTIAKLEKEAYELGKSTHALQRRGSTGDKGSKNDGGRRMIPSLSVANLPYGSVAQGMDAQSFFYRTPTAAPEIPRIQYPPFFMTNTDTITHDVHATQGQGMTDVQHGRATQSMQTSQQWPPVPAAFAESSDSQIHNPVSYYHDVSGQSFAVMNQAVIPQYLPSAPAAAPVVHRPNPTTASFTHHQHDGNTYNHNNGWGEPSTTYASSSSFAEIGSSNHDAGSNNHGRAPTHDGGPSTYYELPAENTWDGLYGQHQL